jgi:pilus assembly protein Flp/PilA
MPTGWHRASRQAQGQRRKVPMFKLMSRFLSDESGVTAIEYGLISALIAVVIIAAVTKVGTNLSGTFQTLAAKV